MGAAVCAAVEAADDLELVAQVGRDGSLGDFADTACDVVVDFTTAPAAKLAIPNLVGRGIHVVSGTTGLTDSDVATIAAAAAPDDAGNVVWAANFAISAALMMRFSEFAAPYFDTVEIVELHHDRKADAPSGTALATAERIAAASDQWASDPTTDETLAGARGGQAAGSIRVHSVRMRGMLAHQEVIFGTAAQTLTIRQDSYGRESFMPGVLLACRRVADLAGFTAGLDAVLD